MVEYVLKRNDGINLRFATAKDKDQIYDFALAAIAGADLPEFAQDAGNDLQERIDEGDPDNVLIAEDSTMQDKIIGYIELDPSRSKKRHAVYIKGIYVLDEYRRRGIGKDMLKIIRDNRVDEDIQLRVEAFTTQGLRFWENFGFEIHHYSLFHNPS